MLLRPREGGSRGDGVERVGQGWSLGEFWGGSGGREVRQNKRGREGFWGEGIRGVMGQRFGRQL